jgi:hypothetical protein
MVLPEEDDDSSGSTKRKHHSPRRIVNLNYFQRTREMEQGSWGRGQYLQLEVLGCLVRAGEQINGDDLVVIHVLLSKSGEHSGYVEEVGLSVNLKRRHGFKFLLKSKPQKTKKYIKTGNPKLRIWKLEVRRRAGRVCTIYSIELRRGARGRKAEQKRKKRQEWGAMSENETERDFVEPMERELGTIARSFLIFLAPQRRVFVPREERKGRVRDADYEGSGPFSFGHTRGAAVIVFVFTGGISRKMEIEK